MLFLIAFQGCEDERQHSRPLLRHQADDVLIVPQEQRPLRHLHACARTWPQSAHCATVAAPHFHNTRNLAMWGENLLAYRICGLSREQL